MGDDLRLLVAAGHFERAATTAAAAISRTRNRVRCADQRQGRHDHHQVFHGILLLKFVSLLPRLRKEPAPLSDWDARRWNLGTMRSDQFPGRESGKRLFAGRRVKEGGRRRRKDGEAKNAAAATLLLLVGFRLMPGTTVSHRLGFRLGATAGLLALGEGSLRGGGCKSDRTEGQPANQKSKCRSHSRSDITALQAPIQHRWNGSTLPATPVFDRQRGAR